MMKWFEAAQNGDVEEIKRLIAKGMAGGIDINAKDRGDSALHLAARGGHTEIVRLLIAANAVISIKDKYGHSPAHDAVVEGGCAEIVGLLIDAGENINAKGKHGRTLLHDAAGQGHIKVANLLIEKGADVNAKDKDGETPMHYAARRGRANAVRILIEANGDVNAKDNGGWTPMHYAIEYEREKVIDLLRSRGAVGFDLGAVYHAAMIGDVDTIKAAIANGMGINDKIDTAQNTMLHWAMRIGHYELAKFLIDAGAKSIRNKYDCTPGELAFQYDNYNLLSLLKKKETFYLT